MTSRYYCGTQQLLTGSQVTLPSDESRHLLKTMRGRVGDHVIVFGAHGVFNGELVDSAGGIATVKLGTELDGPAPPRVEMTFLIPWIKGGKTDFLVQKLTELGAARIIVFQARREVARGDDSKIDRLARIALEACKQCERITVPVIETAQSLKAGIDRMSEIPINCRFILHEREQTYLLTERLRELEKFPSSILFASGPEGGWHPVEINDVSNEITLVSLGSRILRAETAPIVAASAILTLSGDL